MSTKAVVDAIVYCVAAVVLFIILDICATSTSLRDGRLWFTATALIVLLFIVLLCGVRT